MIEMLNFLSSRPISNGMYLITAIQISRNKFREPSLFFSSNKFDVGSIVMTPLDKKNKPAIVIDINDLEKNKSFIRRNKIKINKISDDAELKLFTKEIIDYIKLGSTKTNYSIEEIFQKITPKKITQEINKFDFKKESKDIKNFAEKITKAEIKKKIVKKVNTSEISIDKNIGVKTIGSFLSQPKIEKKSLHSEKHYLVDEIRNYFGETAKKGLGSFSFYLGFFRDIPEKTIYKFWSEVKQSNKSLKDQQKLFWWKIGQYKKEKAGK